jgi:hypothetical protein
MTEAIECGMWNAECGNENGDISDVPIFRIPHSNFPIPLTAQPLKFVLQEKRMGRFDFTGQAAVPVG